MFFRILKLNDGGSMKNKAALIIALCLLATLLSGCTFTNIGIDGVLSAPKLSKEQTQIHDTLIKSVGKNIQLKYPNNGDKRSAFVICNLDDEPSDEAIVFYKRINTSTSESTIRINVLDQINGKWQSVYDSHQAGEEVDKVIVSPIGDGKQTYFTVGFGITNQTDKTMQVYKYSKGVLENIHTETYSIMDILDIDNDKYNEIISISKPSGNEQPILNMCKFYVQGDIVTLNQSSVKLRNDSVSFANMENGMLDDNTKALYIDSVRGDGNIQTEVIYFKDNKLENPFLDNAIAEKTVRQAGYFSKDIDLDGNIEIPTLTPFTGYIGADPLKEIVYNTVWKSFDIKGTLSNKYNSYYNINKSYAFVILDRWTGKVTIKTDTVSDEIIFYKYDGEMNDDMTELMRIKVSSHQKTSEFISKDYYVIKSQGQLDYLIKQVNSKNKDFLMTDSEINDCFHIL